MATNMATEAEHLADLVQGKRIGFVGKLGGMNRREAFRLVRQGGGVPVEQIDDRVDIVVIGADELPIDDDALLDDRIRDAAARGEVEIVNEDALWNRLGMVESQHNVRRLYTPAMLAQLINVSVAVIRRWHRRGLIVPSREVHKLPYFDFQEVSTARRLAELLDGGASPFAIERKLEQLAKLVPGVERPLAQLSVMVEGRQLLLRQGEGLVESDGQMRLNFDEPESDVPNEQNDTGESTVDDGSPHTISICDAFSNDESEMTSEEMVKAAIELEDEGQFDDAAEMYRAALMAGGIDAEICFRLAELLYLQGDLAAARERYSTAIELDEDFVEARSNLGCLLAELGDTELAIASFRGAIKFHPDYPDVHYHLAGLLDELDQTEDATEHWRRFLALAPNSPWADEARQRLGFETTTDEQ